MSNERYCYRIFKKYSLLVDFEGTPHRVNVPEEIENETFARWKKRVLGSDVENVVVFVAIKPDPRTRIKTLKKWGEPNYLKKIFTMLARANREQKNEAVNEAITEAIVATENYFTNFSKETLADLLIDSEDKLEPSVQEFFNNFLNSTKEDIDTEELLKCLLVAYNNAVRAHRELSGLR